ncbi:leptin receptor [Thalassophryne amazonica]|uniref:leptin receptor n=1 Tax=Thalassophryne amazonica TaxID=390379 RepID=UPI001470D49B|nr:leptin receptor [Thalassophryne amazonica]
MTMVWIVTLTVLMKIFLISNGALCLEPEEGLSLHVRSVDLPWQDELCCDSPSAHASVQGGDTHGPIMNRTQSDLPHCMFRGSKNESHQHDLSAGTCLDVLCRIDGNWEHLTCDLQSRHQPSGLSKSGLLAVSLQHLSSQKGDSKVNHDDSTPDNPVMCEANNSFVCSIALNSNTSFVTMVTIRIFDAIAPSVRLNVPTRPVKLNPPTNISHIQTIEPKMILLWNEPSDIGTGNLTYEVRYASKSTRPNWKVVPVTGIPRVPMELKPRVNYTVQVRCSSLGKSLLWSDWSKPHHIFLQNVSYIPDIIVARPGQNVTLYCVFNDRSVNADIATWRLNFNHKLDHSLYRPVNQWVSQVTLRPPGNHMFHMLRCPRGWSAPYSQIFIEGALMDIWCETNGDMDAMDCSWNSTDTYSPTFKYKWADVPCEVMEAREGTGKEIGEACPSLVKATTCIIRPLRMNCYKLWLELSSPRGLIRSKPVLLSPTDRVKPHAPSAVMAVSQRNSILRVTWKPPSLPVDGLQCQFRYRSAVRTHAEWKVHNPVRVPYAEVVVPHVCSVYVVQVRCMHTDGTGYWSDWSEEVRSKAQNSRAPERGPDFWRILQDDPHRKQTNVTLLFEPVQVAGLPYCVDGFIVQHQDVNGIVSRQQLDLMSSYKFEWSQEVHTVTVEAYNSLGSSTNNINMTLEREPKRRCVRSFHVVFINSTCVSLSWSLLDCPSAPLFMVVQWFTQRHQGADHLKGQRGQTWARFPYTEHTVYLREDFFVSEEYNFILYPVFADGEGEPMYTTALRRDPATYMMLMMIISFLTIVLFITLVVFQSQMKRLVWKDVPNPNKCSWAKGLDLKKVDTFELLLRREEVLPAWPLLLPTENISKAIIVEKPDLSDLTTPVVQTFQPSPSPEPNSGIIQIDNTDSGALLGGATFVEIGVDDLRTPSPRIDELQPIDPPLDHIQDGSDQSSVTYATVLCNLKQDQQLLHLRDKDSSSSDEGNFSSNNSDFSGSFPGGLDSCQGEDTNNPPHSCSSNSAEESSKTLEHGDEEVKEERDLYYVGICDPEEDQQKQRQRNGKERQDIKSEPRENVGLNKEHFPAESSPMGPEGSINSGELLSGSTCGFSPVYLSQFRTAPTTRN